MQPSTIVAVLAALAAVVVANPGGYGGYGGGIGVGGGLGGAGGWGWAYPKYSYQYGVSDKHTGDQKTATETRDGGITKGSYSVLQPDGVLRIVNYVSTPKGGFQAQVLNKGWAAHPGGKIGGYGGSIYG